MSTHGAFSTWDLGNVAEVSYFCFDIGDRYHGCLNLTACYLCNRARYSDAYHCLEIASWPSNPANQLASSSAVARPISVKTATSLSSQLQARAH